MLAFIGGPDTFIGPGQIYIKRLQTGDTMQLTNDRTLKTSPVFSPDNSQITYSVPPAWDTWVVPSIGGKPRLMLANASGLSWIDAKRILFSEIKLGRHMAIVTAGQDRSNPRNVYLPPQANGMAHMSYISPDHKSVLVVEMDNVGFWLPCRLVPLDGASNGNEVGPEHAPCTSAAWSPDGRWMYFSADAGNGFHIWRQGFPDRRPEQITFGPTDEEGIAMAPDGRSFVSSVGLGQSTVWIHDGKGDRQISSQGYAFLPTSDGVSLTHSVFSPDKSKLYYLVGTRYFSGGFISGELWMSSLGTGHNEPVVRDLPIDAYDISPDGKRVIFAVRDAGNKSHLRSASLDRRVPPHQIRPTAASDGRLVYGPGGELFFQAEEGGSAFICRMNEDGTGRQKVIREPVVQFQGVSPDGEWVLAQAAAPGSQARRGIFAYSVRDGSRIPICYGSCFPSWSPDGGTFLVALLGLTSSAERNTTFAIPLRARQIIPSLPPEGIKSEDDIRALKGFKVTEGMAYFLSDTSVYAYTRSSVHRNLYRIPVP